MKNPQGQLIKITAPREMTRFDELKVGGVITAQYYENVVLRVKKPGEKDVNTTSDVVTPGTGANPSGTSASQRTIIATITAIDPNVPSVTLSGPNNWTYSSRIADKANLKLIKVGRSARHHLDGSGLVKSQEVEMGLDASAGVRRSCRALQHRRPRIPGAG